jgi:outer membrane protein TolC
LLLDWPGIQLPKFTGVPPPLKHLAANQQQRSSTIPIAPAPLKPSSCKETTNVTLIPPMLPPSSIGIDNDDSNAALPSAFNLTLDPQFLASVQKHQQLQQKTVIEQHPSVESASGRSISASTSVKLSNNSSATPGYPTDSAAINSDWLLLQVSITIDSWGKNALIIVNL